MMKNKNEDDFLSEEEEEEDQEKDEELDLDDSKKEEIKDNSSKEEIEIVEVDENIFVERDPFDEEYQNDNVDQTRFQKNKKGVEKQFENYAKLKFNMLSRKKRLLALKKGPPVSEYLVSEKESGYEERYLLVYLDNIDYLNELVDGELSKISKSLQFYEKFTAGTSTGNGILTKFSKFLMLIQGLQYYSGDLANRALQSNKFANTIDNLDPEKAKINIFSSLHERFESQRKLNWESVVRTKNNLQIAKSMAITPSLLSFVGRLFTYCPTRGSVVFEYLIAFLCSGKISNIQFIPQLFSKIKIILTGKYTSKKLNVLSNGTPWIHAPLEIAKKLKSVLGKEKFSLIENQLYGVYGWVYRESDIANRHGHCNSHPNPNLVKNFKGFDL